MVTTTDTHKKKQAREQSQTQYQQQTQGNIKKNTTPRTRPTTRTRTLTHKKQMQAHVREPDRCQYKIANKINRNMTNQKPRTNTIHEQRHMNNNTIRKRDMNNPTCMNATRIISGA